MSLAPWIAAAGSWQGPSTLQDPMNNIAEESASALTVTPVLGGRFVRLDYTWSYQGAPQEGSLLLGVHPKTAAASVHWIDSWHMGHVGMACTGRALEGAENTLSVRGSYAAPPGPDWGWRIDLAAPEDGSLRLTMFNVWPEGGREELAVAAIYTRA
jgi:Protein of unknown function (DUF1579)